MTHKTNTLFAALSLLLILFLCAGTAAASSTDVENAIQKGLNYLAVHQMSDGGFAEAGASNSTISPTWFAVCAILAAGEEPADWKVNGNNPLDYYDTFTTYEDGTGELGKAITYLAAFGKDPYNWKGINFVEKLKDKIKEDGRGGEYVYTSYWTVFGLIAAGETEAAQPTVAWLKTQQLDNGGWSSFGKEYGDPSDSDNTAASVMALIAGGVPQDDPAITKAVAFLRNVQEPTGGFNYGYYSESNLASSVWVIQALCAAGVDPATVTKNGKSPVDYVLSLQQEDGSFKYTAYTVDSPTGMTGRAVAALTGKPYPILPGQNGYDLTGSAAATASDTKATPAPTSTSSSSAAWTPITVTDDYGYEVTISSRPEKVVSLAPSNTEILFAVGAGDQVVGVTEYCNYPEEVKTRAVIGGYTSVNVERVVTLQPDLIIAYYGNGLDTVNHLKTLGYNVLTLNADSLNGTYTDISLIGTATGHAAEAEKIVSDMKARIKAVNDKVVANVKPEDYPTVAHIVWTDPFWVSGGNTFEDDMITLAGGKNAFSDVNGWGIVTLEKFLTTDPAILLVDSQNYLSSGDDVLKQYFYTEPRVKTLSAVKNNQVNLFNADLIDRGGPRMAECIERIAAILHPDLFDAPVETKQTASPGFSGFAAIAAAAALAGVILVSRRR